jgi:hypothetical protein
MINNKKNDEILLYWQIQSFIIAKKTLNIQNGSI